MDSMEMRRLACKNCGRDVSFSLSTELKDAHMSIFGKCPHCNSTIQLEIYPQNLEKKKGVDMNAISMPDDTNLDDILS
jgi:RNase P subunit RPR2